VLYHMAEDGSWESIRQIGLLSTSALLDRFEVEGERRYAIESTRRCGLQWVPLRPTRRSGEDWNGDIVLMRRGGQKLRPARRPGEDLEIESGAGKLANLDRLQVAGLRINIEARRKAAS
jgi:hypothetical protein